MAKAFSQYSYTTDAGTVVKIRMANTSAAVTGQGPTNTTLTDSHVWAYSSNHGNRRKQQLNARGILLSRTVGSGVTAKVFKSFVPITTRTALDALAIGTDVPIDGVTWKIADKISEA